MPAAGDSDSTPDAESVGPDDEKREYSRRNFMETAAAAGAVGPTAPSGRSPRGVPAT